MRLFRKYDKFLIQVNYSSGHSERFWVLYLRVNYTGGKLNEFEWAVPSASRKPIFVNVDSIESVWQIKYKPGRKQYEE